MTNEKQVPDKQDMSRRDVLRSTVGTGLRLMFGSVGSNAWYVRDQAFAALGKKTPATMVQSSRGKRMLHSKTTSLPSIIHHPFIAWPSIVQYELQEAKDYQLEWLCRSPDSIIHWELLGRLEEKQPAHFVDTLIDHSNRVTHSRESYAFLRRYIREEYTPESTKNGNVEYEMDNIAPYRLHSRLEAKHGKPELTTDEEWADVIDEFMDGGAVFKEISLQARRELNLVHAFWRKLSEQPNAFELMQEFHGRGTFLYQEFLCTGIIKGGNVDNIWEEYQRSVAARRAWESGADFEKEDVVEVAENTKEVTPEHVVRATASGLHWLLQQSRQQQEFTIPYRQISLGRSSHALTPSY